MKIHATAWRSALMDPRAWLSSTIAASACLTLAAVLVQRVMQDPSPAGRIVTGWALLAIAAVWLLNEDSPDQPLPAMSPFERSLAPWLLSLEAALLLLPAIAWLAVWRSRYELVTGWNFGFLNKRWLVALYLLGVTASVVLPLVMTRLRAAQPKDIGSAAVRRASPLLKPIAQSAGLAAAVAVAWLVAGPPWHVDRLAQPFDLHEAVHLGPIQAIDQGYLPFIGPASTQYGPGSQLLTYRLMKATGRFDIVAFREAQLWIHFGVFVIVAVLAQRTVGTAGMVWVVLLAGELTPLSFFRFGSDGMMHGFYGWSNALRYLAPLLVVPAIAHRMAVPPGRERWPGLPVVGLGGAWGLLAYVSQENLVTTPIALAVVVGVLVLTRTTTSLAVGRMIARVLVGMAAVWIPVLAWYASHDALRAFVRNYLLASRYIPLGYSNMWWADDPNPAARAAYYCTGPFVAAIAVASVWSLRPIAYRSPMAPGQVRMLAFSAVVLACYQSALYRSDSWHLLNALLALPFLIVLALRDLPRWHATTWIGQAGVRLVMVAVVLAIFPLGSLLDDAYTRTFSGPHARLASGPSVPSATERGIPFERATPALVDLPMAGRGMPPMRPFLQVATEVREFVGTRPTYVTGKLAGAYSGLWYFLLDLTPGPYLLDRESMVVNDEVAREAFDHFRLHATEFEAVIAPQLDIPEVQAFLAAHPGAERRAWSVGGFPIIALRASAR